MSSQPARNDQSIANGQNEHGHNKFYSPFKPASYYGQNAAAAAASNDYRDSDDEGRLKYHDPSYQNKIMKHQEELHGKDAHRWDKVNVNDEDVGAEAAGNHDNIAKRGLNVFRSWWNGSNSSSTDTPAAAAKEYGKVEANVANRAENYNNNDKYAEARNLAEMDQHGGKSLFGGIKDSIKDKIHDITQDGGKSTHQEVDDINFRSIPAGNNQGFDRDVTPLNPYVSGNKSSISAFGSSNHSDSLMPSARLQRSALICKQDLDTFERCVKKYDYNDDRCKDAWDAFVRCNETIPTKL